MKKLALVVPALAGFSAFAENSAVPAMDTTMGSGIITSAQTGLTTILETAGTAVTAILLIGLGIWAGMAVVRLIKRAFSRGA